MPSLTYLASTVALLGSLAQAGYVLQDDYGNDSSFFDKFQFFQVSRTSQT